MAVLRQAASRLATVRPGRRFWFAAGGGSLGLFAGAAALVSETDHRRVFTDAVSVEYPTTQPKKGVLQLARKIVSPVDDTGLNLRLYQYQTCPFCSKVRVFLDYYGFSYEVVEVNPVNRWQIKFSKNGKVPVVVAQGGGDKELNDSSAIISILRSLMINEKQSLEQVLEEFPRHLHVDAKGRERVDFQNKYFLMCHESLDNEGIALKREEREWREWVDDVFIHTISPNVYRSPMEAVQTFRWFSTRADWHLNFGAVERFMAVYVGAAAMYFIGKRLKKRHGLHENVRLSLYSACQEWTKAVGTQRPFMGGVEPSLADLALYGAMQSFEGCSAFDDMAAKTDIMRWYQPMQEAVKQRRGAKLLTSRPPAV